MSTPALTTGLPTRARRRRGILARISATWSGRIGLVLVIFVVFVAFVGPLLAPHDPTQTVAIPGSPPSGAYPFGTDYIGRDVLSRLMNGGHSTLLLSLGAIALTYTVGGFIGLTAGSTQSLLDPLLMRSMDVLLSVPALLVIMLLTTGLGSHPLVLMAATALVLIPGASRIVRSATLEVSTKGYVEAALSRGETRRRLMLREILPNIAGVIVADFGLRYSWSIILIASVSFLGIGLQPPASDWGLMVSENRTILETNIWSVAAPALILAVLIIGVNLVGDAYVRQLDSSGDV